METKNNYKVMPDMFQVETKLENIMHTCTTLTYKIMNL